jgi:hypothetical protein
MMTMAASSTPTHGARLIHSKGARRDITMRERGPRGCSRRQGWVVQRCMRSGGGGHHRQKLELIEAVTQARREGTGGGDGCGGAWGFSQGPIYGLRDWEASGGDEVMASGHALI